MTKQEFNTQAAQDPLIQQIMADMKEDLVKGVPPITEDEITIYDDPVAKEFEINELLNDNILVEFVDDNKYTQQGGLVIATTASSQGSMWRTGIIRKIGPKVEPPLTVGTYVRFTNDRGIPINTGKKKMIFMSPERIFATLKHTGKARFSDDIIDNEIQEKKQKIDHDAAAARAAKATNEKPTGPSFRFAAKRPF